MPQQNVFLSFVSGDRLAAERLRSALIGAGLAIAIDISRADRFLACFGSGWNEPEIQEALDHVRHLPRATVWLLPVKVAACDLPPLQSVNGETLLDFPVVDLHRNALDRFAQMVAALPAATGAPQHVVPAGRVSAHLGTLRVGGEIRLGTDGTAGDVQIHAQQTTVDKNVEAGTQRSLTDE